MGWLDTVIKVGVPLVGTLLGQKATSDATKKQTQAIQQASQQVATTTAASQADIKAQLERSRADIEPWRQAGVNALGVLTKLNTPGAMAPGEVENMLRNMPGFDFQEAELQKNIDRRHAASGNRFSGRGLKEMTRWMQENLYAPTYRNWMSDLQTLAGYGREGNQMVASLGQNATNTAANLASGAGTARANLTAQAGQVAGDQALASGALWANGLNQLAKNFAPEDPITAYYRSLATR